LKYFALSIWMLALLLAACDGEPPSPTPTRALSGPTLEASPQPFLGPPTEAPPDIESGIGQNDPTAAALPGGAALPPMLIGTPGSGRQGIEITADDGTLLYGDLLQNTEIRMPGALLLGTDRTAWGGFPEQLNDAGYTVLVMELREGAGVADVRVMIDALTSGMADPGRIAVIGAARGADLALLGCAAVATCDTAILLSPLQEQTILNEMPRFNPRPLLQAVSQADEESFTTAQAVDAAATGDKLFQPLDNAGRGTAILLNRPDVGDLIIQWLQRVLV
jgi:hypothetical protein